MAYINNLLAELESRNVTPADLEAVIHSLLHARNVDRSIQPVSDPEVMARISNASRAHAELLTAEGMRAQVTWLACFHDTASDVNHTLSTFLNIPLAV